MPTKLTAESEIHKGNQGTTSNIKTSAAEKKLTNNKKRRKPAENVVIETSNDPNLEIALALSASLAQAKEPAGFTTLESDNVNKNELPDLGDNKALQENRIYGPTTDDTCTVPDVIMPNASCWWKKPISPTSRKAPVTKRGCNRKNGKTKLEFITNAERNLQIAEQVSHILAGANRYMFFDLLSNN